MRKFLIGFVALMVGLPIVAWLLPMGEIVTLHTVDEDGRSHASALWVVDRTDGPHLRARSPDVAWLDRLILHPRVTLERGERTADYRAELVEDAALRTRIDRAMAEKYGVAERWLRRFREVDQAVVVRLTPVETPPGLATPGVHDHGG